MPAVALAEGGTPVARDYQPSGSTVPSLGGGDAKTPLIAGSVCGGLMAIAWIIGFTIYFRKRWKRKMRNRRRRAGLEVTHSTHAEDAVAQEKVVIPPDPAVLLGKAEPGSDAFAGMEDLRRPRISRGLSRAKEKLEEIFEQEERGRALTDARPSTSGLHPASAADSNTLAPNKPRSTPPRHSRQSSRGAVEDPPPSTT
ncbi:hypothetical protein BD626DRAFT_13215 [Schizophyllum amplum]|uniref:Uncharacterized protein n=1 Tax=Schizophyllum amplum TaxID=97359 RepID=A0A550CXH7_9AGAR|nr:hypothetical protein BD626DRAFT_13215 [Auriculariopsis ampla]